LLGQPRLAANTLHEVTRNEKLEKMKIKRTVFIGIGFYKDKIKSRGSKSCQALLTG
jgi:hypothetical protein